MAQKNLGQNFGLRAQWKRRKFTFRTAYIAQEIQIFPVIALELNYRFQEFKKKNSFLPPIPMEGIPYDYNEGGLSFIVSIHFRGILSFFVNFFSVLLTLLQKKKARPKEYIQRYWSKMTTTKPVVLITGATGTLISPFLFLFSFLPLYLSPFISFPASLPLSLSLISTQYRITRRGSDKRIPKTPLWIHSSNLCS